jgi:hypothetical protein
LEYNRANKQTVEAYINTWQLNNPISDIVNLKNFERRLSFSFEGKQLVNNYWYVPASNINAIIQDSFTVYRYLCYSATAWERDLSVLYYIVPTSYHFTNIQQLIRDQKTKAANIRQYRSIVEDELNGEDSTNKYTGNHLAVRQSSQKLHGRDAPLDDGCEWVVIEWYWQTWVNGILISEVYLFSTSEALCEPGAGGNNSGDTIIVPKNNPCDSVNKITGNTEFKNKIDSLKSKTNGNREFGFYFLEGESVNQISETEFQGQADTLGVDFVMPSFQIDGVVHNHFFKDGESISTFSIQDMATFIHIYQQNKIKNPYSFSYTLVSQSGSQYMLKIQDLQKFSTFATSFQNPFLLKTMWGNNFKIDKTGQNYTAHNETNLLKIFQAYQPGLKLFRKTNTSANWEPIKHSSGQIVSDPCN